jgi:hypothetical protein
MLAADEKIVEEKRDGPDTGCEKGATRGGQEIVLLMCHFSHLSAPRKLDDLCSKALSR